MEPLHRLIACLKAGNKVLVCGNGGSSAQASHFAAELVVRYKETRRALPCIALNDPAILTAGANDLGFEQVFRRQVEAYGRPGDLLIAISTSGKSRNVLLAIEEALASDMYVVALTGSAGVAPDVFTVPAEKITVIKADRTNTAAIQERHMHWLHQWARQIEEAFL